MPIPSMGGGVLDEKDESMPAPSHLRETFNGNAFATSALDGGDLNDENALIVARELMNMSHEDCDSLHAFSEWRIVVQASQHRHRVAGC